MGDLNEYCKHGDVEAYCADCWIELKQQREALLIDLAASLEREDALKQQRDELLAALERIASSRVVLIAEAAIAKVKP